MKEFGVLFEAERAFLLARAMLWLDDYHDAEDLVQDAALDGFRSFGQFDPEGSFRDWICGVLEHEYRDSQREAMRQVRTCGIVEDPDDHPAYQGRVTDRQCLGENGLILLLHIDELREPLRSDLLSAITGDVPCEVSGVTQRKRISRSRKRLFERIKE